MLNVRTNDCGMLGRWARRVAMLTVWGSMCPCVLPWWHAHAGPAAAADVRLCRHLQHFHGERCEHAEHRHARGVRRVQGPRTLKCGHAAVAIAALPMVQWQWHWHWVTWRELLRDGELPAPEDELPLPVSCVTSATGAVSYLQKLVDWHACTGLVACELRVGQSRGCRKMVAATVDPSRAVSFAGLRAALALCGVARC